MKARENPFATDRLERIEFRLEPGTTWAGLEERFVALGCRAALVGPHGSGKTTLAEQLAARWRDRGWEVRMIRLSEESSRLSASDWDWLVGGLNSGHRIIVDGAEQWPWWVWRRFARASRPANGVLITSHQSRRWPTLYECRTSSALLRELVGELAGSNSDPLAGASQALFERHRGNLRDALRELYDFCAQDVGSRP